jgi:hypothetical protein
LKTYSPKEVILQEEFANVYFSKKPHAKKKAKKTPFLKNWPRTSVLIPTASFAILALSFLVFINKFHYQDANMIRQGIKNAQTVKLLDEGRLNRFLTKRLDRQNASVLNGQAIRNGFVTLGNAKPDAELMALDFKFPVDISDKKICLEVRGKRGGEVVLVSLKDSAKRSYRFGEMYLDSKWSTKELPLGDMASTINLTGIEGLRLEYETSGDPNKRYDVIQEVYIKDIRFIKR